MSRDLRCPEDLGKSNAVLPKWSAKEALSAHCTVGKFRGSEGINILFKLSP